MNSRYWTLAERPPPPWPDEDTFELHEAPIPTPGPGQALTRTIYVSLDPYQWGYKTPRRRAAGRALPRAHGLAGGREPDGRLRGGRPRLQHQRLGRVRPDGRGRRAARLHDPAQARSGPGTHLPGRRRARHAGPDRLRRHDPAGAIPRRARPRWSRRRPAASARSPASWRGCAARGWSASPGARRSAASWSTSWASTPASRTCSPTFAEDLQAACPNGVDVYFENVGGAVFDAVLPLFNPGARMTICGLIAHYGDAPGPTPAPR